MTIQEKIPRPIRVMIVDDHKSIVWGLERLVESAHPNMEVVGTANTCAEMLEKIALASPDVILLDIDLDGINAIDVLHDVQRLCNANVLMLTGGKDTDIHQAAFMQGARGVIGKEVDATDLLRAIELVHSGEVWINRAMTGKILGSMYSDNHGSSGSNGGKHHKEPGRYDSLTRREREIVRAVIEKRGAKSQVIAEAMGISENTLRNHLSVIYDKLGVHNRIDLYAYASEHGIAPP